MWQERIVEDVANPLFPIFFGLTCSESAFHVFEGFLCSIDTFRTVYFLNISQNQVLHLRISGYGLHDIICRFHSQCHHQNG